jgi:hypothetical protein
VDRTALIRLLSFWLDMSTTAINSLPIPTWKKVLLLTLHNYGAIVMDTSKDNYLWGWMTESGNQYLTQGVQDQWAVIGAAQALVSGSDWSAGPTSCSAGQVEGVDCSLATRALSAGPTMGSIG